MPIKRSSANLGEIHVEVIWTVVRGWMAFVMVNFMCQSNRVKGCPDSC